MQKDNRTTATIESINFEKTKNLMENYANLYYLTHVRLDNKISQKVISSINTDYLLPIDIPEDVKKNIIQEMSITNRKIQDRAILSHAFAYYYITDGLEVLKGYPDKGIDYYEFLTTKFLYFDANGNGIPEKITYVHLAEVMNCSKQTALNKIQEGISILTSILTGSHICEEERELFSNRYEKD